MPYRDCSDLTGHDHLEAANRARPGAVNGQVFVGSDALTGHLLIQVVVGAGRRRSRGAANASAAAVLLRGDLRCDDTPWDGDA